MASEVAPKRIVFGVTGGIAAYKAVGAIRALVLRGYEVDVVATEHALQFVGAATLEAISRRPLNVTVYDDVARVKHVALAQDADLVVVAPATANTIAKFANGIADNLLTNVLLATTAPILIAPAMHTEMWNNSATKRNIALLRASGVAIVGPGVGQLTGSDSGAGRLAEVDEIVDAALELLAGGPRSDRYDDQPTAVVPQDLVGLRVLVSAGGTREPIDPVRYIGNRSSGKQGIALARAATERGADVVLVASNLETDDRPHCRVNSVSSTAELERAMREWQPWADVVIMAAAVADYRPENAADHKIKKETQGDQLQLSLVQNPDILKELTGHREPQQTIVGFAAETEPDEAARLKLGREKVIRKGADLLVLNRVSESVGFASDVNSIHIITLGGEVVAEYSGDKVEVAHRVLDAVRSYRDRS